SAVAILRPRDRRIVIRIAQHIICGEGVTTVADMCPAAVDPASPEALRDTFSRFPQGVALIAADVVRAPVGLVASTLTAGVSLAPTLVIVALQNSSTTWPALRRATELGISLLSTEQQALARQLASKDHARRFSGVDPEVSADGALTIPGSSTLLWTRHYSEFAGGEARKSVV